MAVTALLKFTQGVTVGTSGQALFGVSGTSVQVSNGAASPGPVSTWTFTVLAVPSGSAVPLGVAQSGVVSTWSFTPDVDGCYLIEITVEDAFGNTASDARCFGIKTTSGRLIPCFLADSSSLNFGGQATGWDVYMEAWLQALETLIGGGGGTPSPYVIDCTAGGTITYAGPTSPFPLAGIKLTGTPGAGFALKMPTGLGYLMPFLNYAGQVCSVYPNGGGGIAQIPANAGPVIVYSDGSTTAGPNFLTSFAADVGVVNMNGFSGLGVLSIGAVNQNDSGQQATCPIYGTVLNRFDAATWGITVPTLGIGPVPFQTGEAELVQVDPGTGDNALTYGRLVVSQSGAYQILGPEVRYAHGRQTQAMLEPHAKWGETLVGPSASSAGWEFDVPLGTTTLEITCSARVTEAGGGGEAVGDSYVTKTTVTWKNVAGTVSVVPQTMGQVYEAADASMVGTSFTAGTTGTQAQIYYATNSTIDGGTFVDVQITAKGDVL